MPGETILIVEDEKLIRWSVLTELQRRQYSVLQAESLTEARLLVAEHDFDVILLDQILPDGNGLDLARELRAENSASAIIMLTAVDTSQAAVAAMKLGVYDYLTKPVDPDHLSIAISKALETTHLKRQLAHLHREQEQRYGLSHFIGASPAMQSVFQTIMKIARSDTTTVLITGESGTGKELAARAIHVLSSRKDNPFMAVNCSALTETLVESELFGHEKGAFTDARSQRKGLFELAHTGMVFLDEIGDMPLGLQARLLRVLEEKVVRRLGGSEDIATDVRIIAATNQRLEEKRASGSFRTDLYFRLNVAHLHMPPARERGDDVLLLGRHFLHEFNIKFHKRFTDFTPETCSSFREYDWPGNVREIRNLVERGVLLDDGEYLDIPGLVARDSSRSVSSLRSDRDTGVEKRMEKATPVSFADHEKAIILRALEEAVNNQSHAARILKISRDALRYKMKKYGLL